MGNPNSLTQGGKGERKERKRRTKTPRKDKKILK
jgi:hypothetical protein